MKYIFNQWYCAMHRIYYSGDMCPKCATGQDKCNGGGGYAGQQKSGKVVIEVCVNSSGTVVSADYTQRGSTTSDSELKSKALQAAKGYRFASSSADQQCGTITFNFTLK